MFTIPVLNIKANPLDALLAAIGIRLGMLAKSKDPKIQALFEDRKISIELGSKADGVARYYVFDNGSYKQYVGSANNPKLRIDFKDSATGIRLLTAGDVAAFMTAVQEKDVTMEGDYSLLMWFSQLAKHIVPAVPDEVKPFLNKAKPLADKAQTTASHLFDMAKHKFSK